MTWTHTCCWTDHSNGCPFSAVGGFKSMNEKHGTDWPRDAAIKFWDEYYEMKTKLYPGSHRPSRKEIEEFCT